VFDARGVSNRFIAFFGVLLFFRFYFDWGESVWVSTYMPGAGEFVLLALAPFLGRYLDLGQLGVCRTVLACGWLLSALFKVYVHGSIDAGVLAISQSTFASLIMQAGLIELLARLLCKSENSAGFRSLIGGRRGTAETA
jgi:hypothetical protein